ncbi:hypothetical protein ONO86_00755 [Micromonospora noduli]|nr:hypothetical protein ONO86_00755 [Micromonospora noduli]
MPPTPCVLRTDQRRRHRPGWARRVGKMTCPDGENHLSRNSWSESDMETSFTRQSERTTDHPLAKHPIGWTTVNVMVVNVPNGRHDRERHRRRIAAPAKPSTIRADKPTRGPPDDCVRLPDPVRQRRRVERGTSSPHGPATTRTWRGGGRRPAYPKAPARRAPGRPSTPEFGRTGAPGPSTRISVRTRRIRPGPSRPRLYPSAGMPCAGTGDCRHRTLVPRRSENASVSPAIAAGPSRSAAPGWCPRRSE